MTFWDQMEFCKYIFIFNLILVWITTHQCTVTIQISVTQKYKVGFFLFQRSAKTILSLNLIYYDFPLFFSSLMYQGSTLFLTSAYYSLIDSQTTYKMTSQLSILAERQDMKNPTLYFLFSSRLLADRLFLKLSKFTTEPVIQIQETESFRCSLWALLFL